MTTQELKPSIELLDAIRVIQQKYGESKDLVYNAYKLAIRDKFSPTQARDFLFAQLPFLSESTIRKALPAEAKDQSKVRSSFAVNLSQNKPKSDSNIVNITTKAKIQDADLVSDELPPNAPTKTSEQFYKEQERELADQKNFQNWKEHLQKTKEMEEEPTELELANIKIAQLEDALHQIKQFKSATALQPQEDDINIVKVRAGVGAIENLIRLEIPKLKNRGWKTVEITMRAV